MIYARCLCVCLEGGGACPFSFSMWIEVLVVISILNVHQCNPRHYIHSEPVKHQQDERETAKGIKLIEVLLLKYYRNQLKELNWSRWLRIFILPHAIYNVYIVSIWFKHVLQWICQSILRIYFPCSWILVKQTFKKKKKIKPCLQNLLIFFSFHIQDESMFSSWNILK